MREEFFLYSQTLELFTPGSHLFSDLEQVIKLPLCLSFSSCEWGYYDLPTSEWEGKGIVRP